MQSLQLKSEYDKEIEEAVAKIKEKYELKHREKEARFASLKDVYEQRSTRLQQTWCLCETFYTKCSEPGTPSSKSGTQQGEIKNQICSNSKYYIRIRPASECRFLGRSPHKCSAPNGSFTDDATKQTAKASLGLYICW